ncbi:hypothetical protein GZ159_09520 [Staphylococcus aureus]|uniref:hypothetical protein n=1 Tax=Staphylococcus aureus TaxID=1280 RepID=UPI0013A6F158|nr:hypothetical protein [Staphylococcus aureus]NDQ74009.1 hypothetical protein [Staphylococcus aureus]HDZ8817145.1 hypothetical protein [Staphylococcus aureus]
MVAVALELHEYISVFKDFVLSNQLKIFIISLIVVAICVGIRLFAKNKYINKLMMKIIALMLIGNLVILGLFLFGTIGENGNSSGEGSSLIMLVIGVYISP